MKEDRNRMQEECAMHMTCKDCPLLINNEKYRVLTDNSGYTYTVTCAIKLNFMQEYYGDKLLKVDNDE